jgi:hypothetical protein
LTSYVFSWPLIYTSVASPELVGFVLLATTSLGAGVVASQLVFTKISHERRLGNPRPPADQLSIWLKGLTLVSFGLGIWAVIVYAPNLGFDNLLQNLDRGTAHANANVATMMPRSERLAFLIVSAFFFPIQLFLQVHLWKRYGQTGKDLTWAVLSILPPIFLTVFTARNLPTALSGLILVFVALVASQPRNRLVVGRILAGALILLIVLLANLQLRASSAAAEVQRGLANVSASQNAEEPILQECALYPGTEECIGSGANTVDKFLRYGASYATQGYFGLQLSLENDWRSGGGLAHARALSSLLTEFGMIEPTGNLCQGTVVDQLNCRGYTPYAVWFSGFAQLASDAPWSAVVVIIFLASFVAHFSLLHFRQTGSSLALTTGTYSSWSLFWLPQWLPVTAVGWFHSAFLAITFVYLVRLGATISARKR